MSDNKYIRKTARYNGKKYEATGKTEREAMLKLAEKLRQAEEGMVGGEMTVDRWYKEWVDTYKKPQGLTEKSLHTYDQKYYGRISPRIGSMKLSSVREVHLQRIMNDQQGMSFSHTSKVLMVLQGMFRRARQSRLIQFDPAELLQMPSTTKGHRRSLTQEERQAFLAVAETHPAGLFIKTLLYTGIRPGEAAALRWVDVDFQKKEIHVHAAMEGGSKAVKGPKTAAGVRDIPILPELLNALHGAVSAPLSPVFPGADGSYMTANAIQAKWKSFSRAVDRYMGAKVYRNQIVEHALSRDLTLYCLRHTFATDLQSAGVPINVAKELMGHSDIAVTANIYTHKDSNLLHESMALLTGTGGKSGGKQKDETA